MTTRKKIASAVEAAVEAANELARLRAVAEAATPGPWQTSYLEEGIAEIETVSGAHVAIADGDPTDATHIAAFDPPTVVALIDTITAQGVMIRELERRNAELFDGGAGTEWSALRAQVARVEVVAGRHWNANAAQSLLRALRAALAGKETK